MRPIIWTRTGSNRNPFIFFFHFFEYWARSLVWDFERFVCFTIENIFAHFLTQIPIEQKNATQINRFLLLETTFGLCGVWARLKIHTTRPLKPHWFVFEWIMRINSRTHWRDSSDFSYEVPKRLRSPTWNLFITDSSLQRSDSITAWHTCLCLYLRLQCFEVAKTCYFR